MARQFDPEKSNFPRKTTPGDQKKTGTLRRPTPGSRSAWKWNGEKKRDCSNQSAARFVGGRFIMRLQLIRTAIILNAELIASMRGTRIFVPTLLAVLCGLRRGEICALRWRSIDLVAGRLAIIESGPPEIRCGVRPDRRQRIPTRFPSQGAPFPSQWTGAPIELKTAIDRSSRSA